jgi:ribosomal protein S18 acetylase RimI-like enzyme
VALTFADLSGVSYTDLAAAFESAFADYTLATEAKSEDWVRNRLAKNAYDPTCSAGAFDGDRLVGFMLHGVADWRGERIAFDAATGILPDYRGQGLAGQLFEFTRPRLRERDVTRCILEVLKDNQAAIRSYHKMGFAITREFACFELLLTGKRPAGGSDPEIFTMGKEALDAFEDQRSWIPSWENSFASIRRIPDTIYILVAVDEGRPAGLLVYYPTLNWLMSIIVRQESRGRGVGSRLLDELLRRLPASHERIRAIDCLRDDRGLVNFFTHRGFVEFAAQYEMSRPI